jgi:hypothetical protein
MKSYTIHYLDSGYVDGRDEPRFFTCNAETEDEARDIWAEECPGDELLDITEDDPDKWNPDSHWDEHADYPRKDWQYEVSNDDTCQSYIDWVNSQLEYAEWEAEDIELPTPSQLHWLNHDTNNARCGFDAGHTRCTKTQHLVNCQNCISQETTP